METVEMNKIDYLISNHKTASIKLQITPQRIHQFPLLKPEKNHFKDIMKIDKINEN